MERKKKETKISKGYRLKPSTHRMVHSISILINGNFDKVISKACRSLIKDIGSRGMKF